MLYDNIVVPYDGSDPSHAALTEAVRYAREDPGMTLRIVHIVDIENIAIERLESKGVDMADGAMPEGMREAVGEATETASRRLHRKIDPVLDGLMNTVVVEMIAETHPGSQIVAYAQDNACDLIVMGSRGLGAFQGILGSVSSYVIREAPVPVLVVKE